ncbi:immunoglobulin lambda-1 light chain-like isoform X2 [Tachysurus fulvidraco]|uniref:immunoglobulin lambda-1 light chain-like isoform X2 n=1 Tax=Tachysurus fulvidraco TaxID=1234273 RepID=UPI001FF04BBC|nr:immunoglobulin lambda-1 light chain-like isoform X2 [Tachysurus fulvidraco]
MSNMTTVCFLLALIGCVSGQFTPQKQVDTIRRGRNKRISCTVDPSVDLSNTPIHWYRQKHGEALQRILYFAAGASKATESGRFTGGRTDTTFSVTIAGVNDGDAATYYCALWRGDNDKVFSSGTRLYVTDGNMKAPEVSVYPISNQQPNSKSVLMCHARDMFPDMVTFTWKAENERGENVDLKDEEMLEQRDEKQGVKITSMLIVDTQKANIYTFTCSVKHSDKDKKLSIPKDVPVVTCPTPKQKAQAEKEEHKKEDDKEEKEKPGQDGFELSRSLYLFSVTYVILLVKNILYFCIVSVLLYKRNTENKKILRNMAQ